MNVKIIHINKARFVLAFYYTCILFICSSALTFEIFKLWILFLCQFLDVNVFSEAATYIANYHGETWNRCVWRRHSSAPRWQTEQDKEMMLELIRRKESMALSGVSCEELQFDPRFCEVPLWLQGNGQRETVGREKRQQQEEVLTVKWEDQQVSRGWLNNSWHLISANAIGPESVLLLGTLSRTQFLRVFSIGSGTPPRTEDEWSCGGRWGRSTSRLQWRIWSLWNAVRKENLDWFNEYDCSSSHCSNCGSSRKAGIWCERNDLCFNFF